MHIQELGVFEAVILANETPGLARSLIRAATEVGASVVKVRGCRARQEGRRQQSIGKTCASYVSGEGSEPNRSQLDPRIAENEKEVWKQQVCLNCAPPSLFDNLLCFPSDLPWVPECKLCVRHQLVTRFFSFKDCHPEYNLLPVCCAYDFLSDLPDSEILADAVLPVAQHVQLGTASQ